MMIAPRLKHVAALLLGLSAAWSGWAQPADEPVRPPALRRAETPQYPNELRMLALGGTVQLDFTVQADGSVADIKVVRSDNPRFERPSIEAVRRWKFKPARKGNQPVAMRIRQAIVFELEGNARTWEVAKGKNHDQVPPAFRWAVAPVASFTVYPVYPLEQLLAGTKGRVKANFVVGADGNIRSVRVIESTTPEMAQAVAAALEVWEFRPAKGSDGRPSLALVEIEFGFDPNGLAGVPVDEPARQILTLLRKRPEQIVPLAQLDRAPQAWSQHAPVYPLALREGDQEGEAVIEFFIDERGDVQLPRVVSATAPEFGYAAVQAVAAWRYEPPLRNGKPVVARVQLPLGFKLQ